MDFKKTARLAGLFYLLVAVFSGFAFSSRVNLIVKNNDAATVNNIVNSQTLFRLSIISELIGQVFFIFLVLFFYQLFKQVNKNSAITMAVLALIPVPITCLNVINQYTVLQIINDPNYLKLFNFEQLHNQVMFYLNLHHSGVMTASLFWGLWLFPLGFLVIKSGFINKVIGIFLLIAGFGYIIDCVLKFMISGYNFTISSYLFIGELLLTFRLLFKGIEIEPIIKYQIKNIEQTN